MNWSIEGVPDPTPIRGKKSPCGRGAAFFSFKVDAKHVSFNVPVVLLKICYI